MTTLNYQNIRKELKKLAEIEKQKLYNVYTKHFRYINSWDLVDVTSPHIVGRHLMHRIRYASEKLPETKRQEYLTGEGP